MIRSTIRIASIARIPSSSSSGTTTATIFRNVDRKSLHSRRYGLVPVNESILFNSSICDVQINQRRGFANAPPPKKGFFGNLIESIQEEMSKNKDLKDNLKKLKEETEKLEQSDALQKARAKYQIVETETLKSTEVLKKQLGELQERIRKSIEEAKKSEMGQQAIKTAREAAEKIEKSAEALGKTQTYKIVSESVQTIKHELDEVTIAGARMYRSPEKLRKRKEIADDSMARTIEVNTEATGVELHKDSRWYQSWKGFTENNAYINKFLDWKMRYEESENPFVRVARFFTDRIQSAASGLLSDGKLSDALTEIARVDPTFDRHRFLLMCEQDIIPNVLEANSRGELEILKDWCTERAFHQLSFPGTEAKRAGYIFETKIVDVRRADLVSGAVLDVGPTLIIQFASQQFRCVRTPDGKVTEGHADRPFLVDHVWCLCRDMSEMDTRAAWRVTEVHEHARLQLM